jgi:DNA (cytosine-5)-methyltransferase 1
MPARAQHRAEPTPDLFAQSLLEALAVENIENGFDYRTKLEPADVRVMLGGLVVDSFAGGGGASTGIEEALGVSPDVAINHDGEALAMHEANHPETLHVTHNIWKVHPAQVTKGRPVGLLWASPDCKSHSKAKGGKPRNKNIRDLAWVVVHWAKVVRPKLILLENVEEFAQWGPLLPGGKPCPRRLGQTFAEWVSKLERLGYRVEYKELRACDFGAPTIRKRLFLVARCDAKPILWPTPLYGSPKSAAVKNGTLRPWRTAAEIISWDEPCPSIFLSKSQAQHYKAWSGIQVKRPLENNTLARIAKGVKRYVIDAQEPFIASMTHRGGDRTESLREPIRTITAAHRGEKALINPFMTKFRNNAVGADIQDPLPTVTANSFEKRAGCGIPMGLVAPQIVPTGEAIAPIITYAQHGGATRAIDDPLHTVTASTKDNNGVIAGMLVGCGGRAGQSRPRPANEPMATTTTKNDTCLAMPHLISVTHGDSGGRREYPLDEPVGTATTSKTHALVNPLLMSYYGEGAGSTDRSASIEDPLKTTTCENRHALIHVGLIPRYGEREGQEPRSTSLDAPISTITPDSNQGSLAAVSVIRHFGGSVGSGVDEPVGTTTAAANKTGLIATEVAPLHDRTEHFICQQNTGVVGHHPNEPLSTIVGKGCTQTPVAVHMTKMRQHGSGKPMDAPIDTVMAGATCHGLVETSLQAAHIHNMKGSDQRATSTDEPMPTQCAQGNHIGAVGSTLVTYYGTQQAGDMSEPLHTVTTKDRFGLAETAGLGQPLTEEQYEKAKLVAVFLRRFNCWDGGEVVVVRGYVLVDIGLRMLTPRELARGQGFGDDYVLEAEYKGKLLTKTSQTRMIGNSVAPHAARALAYANVVMASESTAKVAPYKPWGEAMRQRIIADAMKPLAPKKTRTRKVALREAA